MDLINKTEWTEQDILNLIATKAEENIHLDFKAADALTKRDGNTSKKAEISKDVSAFANSDGGIIVYGLIEEDHVASKVDFIDGNEFTKEWLELVINGGIQRTIDGLRIFPVRFDDEISKTVYVVVIPASSNAPHINKDKKYYRRYDFQSVPMEEYEIRNLYYRKGLATLVISNFFVRLLTRDIGEWEAAKFAVDITIENDSVDVCVLYKLLIHLPLSSPAITLSADRDKTMLSRVEDGFMISSLLHPPIFQNEPLTLLTFTITMDITNNDLIDSLDILTVSVAYSGGHQQVTFDLREVIINILQKQFPNRQGNQWLVI